MKRFLILLSLLFCNTVCADTINLHWLNEDGSTYQNSTCVIDSDLILPSTPPTKYGYTFTGWKFVSYKPIEYLESTGTQWIDTEYIPNTTTHIKAKIKYNSVTNGETATFGAGEWYYNQSFDMYTWNNKYQFNYGNTYIYGINANVGDVVEIDFNRNVLKYTVNNIQQNTINFPSINFSSPYEMRLYAVKNRDSISSPTVMGIVSIYYFQIYDNDTLVRDFIPVLDDTGTPCMFDRVEGKFYYNAGTGQFIAGPALQ